MAARSTTRWGRVVGVTLGLVVAGIFFGAIAGGTAVTLVLLLAGERVDPEAFLVGAVFGAPLGALTAPVLSWVLLRRVPLGRMFLVCSCGTAVGGVVGWFTAGAFGDIGLRALGGALVGCIVAAITLSVRTRAPESHA